MFFGHRLRGSGQAAAAVFAVGSGGSGGTSDVNDVPNDVYSRPLQMDKEHHDLGPLILTLTKIQTK